MNPFKLLFKILADNRHNNTVYVVQKRPHQLEKIKNKHIKK